MLIPNHADGCRSFFKCHSGTPVLTKCSANLLFNERTNYCDWDYNVQCGGASNTFANTVESQYALPVRTITNTRPEDFFFIYFRLSIFHRIVRQPLMAKHSQITKPVANRIISATKVFVHMFTVAMIYCTIQSCALVIGAVMCNAHAIRINAMEVHQKVLISISMVKTMLDKRLMAMIAIGRIGTVRNGQQKPMHHRQRQKLVHHGQHRQHVHRIHQAHSPHNAHQTHQIHGHRNVHHGQPALQVSPNRNASIASQAMLVCYAFVIIYVLKGR